MKKKAEVGILILTVIASAVLPVNAAGLGQQDMTINYREPNSWIVSIPQTAIYSDTSVMRTLEVSQINVEPGKKLQVKIGQNNGEDIEDGVVILNRTDSRAAVKTNVSMDQKGTEKVGTNSVIAEFQAEDTTPTYGGTIYFSAIYSDSENGVKAGDYAGTMTYRMEIADIQ